MRRLTALFVVLLSVSACEVAVGGANLVSVIYTNKTLLGHAAGAISGQDCSLLNIENKEPFCHEWAQQGGGAVMLYCYPTLGRPECFENPLPNGQGRVSFAAPNPET